MSSTIQVAALAGTAAVFGLAAGAAVVYLTRSSWAPAAEQPEKISPPKLLKSSTSADVPLFDSVTVGCCRTQQWILHVMMHWLCKTCHGRTKGARVAHMMLLLPPCLSTTAIRLPAVHRRVGCARTQQAPFPWRVGQAVRADSRLGPTHSRLRRRQCQRRTRPMRVCHSRCNTQLHSDESNRTERSSPALVLCFACCNAAASSHD